MQEIVNNGVLISDSFPAGEASDLFIENLKENVDVWYDGKHITHQPDWKLKSTE